MKRRLRRTWRPVLLLLAIALIAGGSNAVAAESKGEDWRFHTIVDVDFVKQYAKLPQPEGVRIVDSRPYKSKYVKGHIPTAISIPEIKTLQADKPIVFVCSAGARSGESFFMLQDLRPELKEVYDLEASVNFTKDGSYEVVKTE